MDYEVESSLIIEQNNRTIKSKRRVRCRSCESISVELTIVRLWRKERKQKKGERVLVALVSNLYKKSGDFIEHTPMHIDDGKREEKRSNKNNVRRD